MTFYQQLTDSQRFLSKNPLKPSEYPSKSVIFDLSAPCQAVAAGDSHSLALDSAGCWTQLIGKVA